MFPLFWWINHHEAILQQVVLSKQQIAEESYQKGVISDYALCDIAVVGTHQLCRLALAYIFVEIQISFIHRLSDFSSLELFGWLPI
jgi:hypothetical protein